MLALIPIFLLNVFASQPGMGGGMDQMNQMPQQNNNMDNSNSQTQQQVMLQQMIQQVLGQIQSKLSQQQTQTAQMQQGMMMATTTSQSGTTTSQNGDDQQQQVMTRIFSDLQGFLQKLSSPSSATAGAGSVSTVTQTVKIPLRTFGDNVVDYIRSHSNELTGELGNFLKNIIAKHDAKIQKLRGMICDAPRDNNDWGELDVKMTSTTTLMSNMQQQNQQQQTPTLQWNQAGQQQTSTQQQSGGMPNQQNQQSQLLWQ